TLTLLTCAVSRPGPVGQGGTRLSLVPSRPGRHGGVLGSAQRQDLIDSIRDTEKAIQEIDQVSRQKFAEAFESINNNFRGVFQTLFGGGTGEMRLTDQENLAESGIDIV